MRPILSAFKSFPLTLLLTLLYVGAATAGVTGKISGTVVDAKTGEPLPAATVAIAGTDFGAATSLSGDYFILNIPPGQYSVTASYVGYVSVTQEDVLIYADFTALVDFKLEPTILEGQEVVVKAQRRIVRHDVTASTKLTTGDEIYSLPVANYVGALSSTAGAVGSGNNIHIRGGRAGQVAYLVDGFEVTDPQLGYRMLSVGSPAVAEMITMTGGFDAEFGNAQSAVVNVVTREGSRDEYHGRVKYVMDDLNPKPDSRYEESIAPNGDTTTWTPPWKYQNYDYWEGSIGGPEPLTRYLLPQLGLKVPGYMTLFVSGDLTARNTTSTGIPVGSSEWNRHDAAAWLPGLDEPREHTFLDHSYNLTWHMNPKMKMKFGYRNSRSWTNPYVFRINRTFPNDYAQEDIDRIFRDWANISDSTWTYIQGYDDDGDGRIDEEVLNGIDDDMDGRVDEDLQYYHFNAADHTRMSVIDDEQMLLTWNHTLSQRTYYHLKLSRYSATRQLRGGNKAPENYGEYAEEFTDLPGADGKYNGRYDPGEPFVDTDGDGIWDPGNPSNDYLNYRGFYYTGDGLGGDIGQLVPIWKSEDSYVWGVKFQLTSQAHKNHQIRGGIDYNYFDLASYYPGYPSINNNGWGNYSSSYHVFPSDAALYFQDKMEYKDITLTLGLREDFIIPGEQVGRVIATDSSAADWDANYLPHEVPKRVKTYLSPRFGASFAITEDAYLHAHYGHFYQRARWDDMFDQVNVLQTGGTPVVGNPNLEPEKTVAYEVGVSWNPFKDYLLDVTGYLKDIKNWINTQDGKGWFIANYPQFASSVRNYAFYDNQDYAFARGLEFTLSKEYGANVSGRVSYTLAWVNAKNAYDIGSDIIRNDYVEPAQALPAGWDQRHSVVANLGLKYDADEPLFGVRGMPGDWDFNALWNMSSGLPYTPTDASNTRIEGREMSERTSWTYNLDLNLVKYFTVKSVRPFLWFEVRNVFDRQNIVPGDDNYGRAGKPNAYDDYTGLAGWVNDTASPNYTQNPFAGPNPNAWDNPRFMRIGIGAEF